MFGLFSVLYILANSLLRLAVDGKIVMCVYPPGFINKRGKSIGIFSPMVFRVNDMELISNCQLQFTSEGGWLYITFL